MYMCVCVCMCIFPCVNNIPGGILPQAQRQRLWAGSREEEEERLFSRYCGPFSITSLIHC